MYMYNEYKKKKASDYTAATPEGFLFDTKGEKWWLYVG